MAAVALGLLFRFCQYAARTSIWHDEAYVALNVLHESPAELLGPLQWNEAAPPGFLVAEKAIVLIAGRCEFAWRLLALVGGLLSVVAFAAMAPLFVQQGGAWLWAALLMACSDKLIAQADETKHFTLDVLLSVLLLQTAWRASEDDDPRAALLCWGAIAAAGIWLSYAAALVFAGTSFVLLLSTARRWRRGSLVAWIAANAVFAASAAMLLPSIRAQATGRLLSFWNASFPDFTSIARAMFWPLRTAVGFFDYFWQPLGLATAVLWAIGTANLWRAGRRRDLMLLLAPVLIALAASFAHRWPFGGNQHMVFAAPAVFLTAGAGIEWARARLEASRSGAGAILIALFLLPGIAPDFYHLFSPRHRHEVRPVIEFVRSHRQPGDTFIVQCEPEVEFYTGREFLDRPASPASPRVWYITTSSGAHGLDQARIAKLEPGRAYLLGDQEYGAAAYLFGPSCD